MSMRQSKTPIHSRRPEGRQAARNVAQFPAKTATPLIGPRITRSARITEHESLESRGFVKFVPFVVCRQPSPDPTGTKAVDFGRRVIWLNTFGERFADADASRPPKLPRLKERAPRMPKDGAISLDADSMPDEIEYDEAAGRLRVGKGFIENLPAAVRSYEVSGKRVLTQKQLPPSRARAVVVQALHRVRGRVRHLL